MMKFLWQDSLTKEASASKIWTHIAYGTATYIVIRMENISWEMLLVYMAVVGGSEIAKKILTIKSHGVDNNDSPAQSAHQPPQPQIQSQPQLVQQPRIFKGTKIPDME